MGLISPHRWFALSLSQWKEDKQMCQQPYKNWQSPKILDFPHVMYLTVYTENNWPLWHRPMGIRTWDLTWDVALNLLWEINYVLDPETSSFVSMCVTYNVYTYIYMYLYICIHTYILKFSDLIFPFYIVITLRALYYLDFYSCLYIMSQEKELRK